MQFFLVETGLRRMTGGSLAFPKPSSSNYEMKTASIKIPTLTQACGGMRTHGQGSWQCSRWWGEIYPTLSTTDRQMGSTKSNTEIPGKRLMLSVNQQEEDNPNVCDWGTLTSLSSVLFFLLGIFFKKSKHDKFVYSDVYVLKYYLEKKAQRPNTNYTFKKIDFCFLIYFFIIFILWQYYTCTPSILIIPTVVVWMKMHPPPPTL